MLSSPSLSTGLLLAVVVGLARSFVHLYDNGTLSFVHNANVSSSVRNDSLLHFNSLSEQPLYIVPPFCRPRNTTTYPTLITTVCGDGRLLNRDNVDLLDKVSGETYELLVRQREKYLFKGHESNISLLVVFDDTDCWPYLIDNRHCHRQRDFLRQLCDNLPPRFNEEATPSEQISYDELNTLYNISLLMISIDCITFVLYIGLIVFMIKMLRNAYEPTRIAVAPTPPPPIATTRRFYFVRANSNDETAV